MDRLPFSGSVSIAERTTSIGALGPAVTWIVAATARRNRQAE